MPDEDGDRQRATATPTLVDAYPPSGRFRRGAVGGRQHHREPGAVLRAARESVQQLRGPRRVKVLAVVDEGEGHLAVRAAGADRDGAARVDVGERVVALRVPSGNQRDEEINSYAVPVLRQETLDAQSATSTPSRGASVTSAGYHRSLQAALDAVHFG